MPSSRSPIKPGELISTKPCDKCGARLRYIEGGSYAVWRHPEAHKQEWVKAPIGAHLLPHLERDGNVYQFECESCGNPVMCGKAKCAEVTLQIGT